MAFDLAGLTDRPEKDAKESNKENRLGRLILGLIGCRPRTMTFYKLSPLPPHKLCPDEIESPTPTGPRPR